MMAWFGLRKRQHDWRNVIIYVSLSWSFIYLARDCPSTTLRGDDKLHAQTVNLTCERETFRKTRCGTRQTIMWHSRLARCTFPRWTNTVYGLRRILDAMRHSRSQSPRKRRRDELREKEEKERGREERINGNPAAPSRHHPDPISRLSSTFELHLTVCEIQLRNVHSQKTYVTLLNFAYDA